MKKLVAVALLAGTALTPGTALAQETSLEQQVAALAAEVARLNQRVRELEAEQAQAEAQQSESVAQQAAMAAQVASIEEAAAARPAPSVTSGAPVEISWAGAPEIEGEGGWSFKPRGRLNIDAGSFNAPDSTGREDGFNSEIRRARLGVEGDIPGGFGYKFEIDVAGNEVEVTDAILTYEDGPLTVNVGQHNTFQSLEELTSSRWSSFIERASFTDAFGFERRLGVSVELEPSDTVLIQGGLFSDNIGDLPGKAMSADGRVVFMPEFGDNQLHLGASVHYTDVPEGDTVRYRQRPLVHFTGERFINTGNLPATSEFGAGIEAAFISGPFHAVAEGFWQSSNMVAGMEDANFFGGYAEAGLFLTKGDSRGYRGGTFNRTRPANPVDEGGMGAFQLNLRYDYLDLTDTGAGIVGGTQNGYMASLVWVPTDYTRFLINYARLDYNDAVHAAAGGDRDYSVDVLGMRAQIDF
ncbi:OprO/OprP family phosphate-selective porin [Aurantiacibacter odishensis]|uniref:OprO/OprP family phosphate-selective porin n=1 Tax=Aurantiacibacter odishensis TaxID=1155476 RepID=UPI000E728C45|nr:porin [Aurantiacibacter odishensis]